ncbi:MAG: peptidoglycan DD-metalloendopeptidase family protein [Candidatus Woesearchaeota archaeon]
MTGEKGGGNEEKTNLFANFTNSISSTLKNFGEKIKGFFSSVFSKKNRSEKSDDKKPRNLIHDTHTSDLVHKIDSKLLLEVSLIAGILAVLYWIGILRFNILGIFTAVIVVLIVLISLGNPEKRRTRFIWLLVFGILFLLAPYYLPFITTLLPRELAIFFKGGPVGQKEIYGASFQTRTSRGFKELSAEWVDRLKKSQEMINERINCAMGECPEGEAEGPKIGINLYEPKPFVEKKYVVGDDISFSSVIEGVNLDIYPEKKLKVECSIDKKELTPTPNKIPFSDLSNNQRIITCNGRIRDNDDFINELNVSVVFDFTTESELKMYIMKREIRDSLYQIFGPDFMYSVFGINVEGIAKFNDGPINLGIATPQKIIALSEDEKTTELYIALTNQWYGFNGFITKIKNIEIFLPEGVEITNYDDQACPFVKSGDHYVISSTKSEEPPVHLLRNFVCSLQFNKKDFTEHPLWMPSIKVVSEYEYRISKSTTINIYKTKEQLEQQLEQHTGKTSDSTTTSNDGTTTSSEGTKTASSEWSWPAGKYNGEYSIYNCYGIGWGYSSDFHHGFDIEADGDESYKADIFAVSDGSVETVVDGCPECKCINGNEACCSCNGQSYGNYVIINHGNVNGKNVKTLYAHLKSGSIKVSKGDDVSKGQIIATMGSSGYSTDVHLHFEVFEDGSRVNPINYFDKNSVTLKMINPDCKGKDAFDVCTKPKSESCP